MTEYFGLTQEYWYKKGFAIYGPITLATYLKRRLKKKPYFLQSISMSKDDPRLPMLVDKALEAMSEMPDWKDKTHILSYVQIVICHIKKQIE